MKKSEKGNTKTLVILLIVLILVAGAILAYKIFLAPKTESSTSNDIIENQVAEEVEEKQVQIFNGIDRPIAVMLDNHSDAWPQAGLQKAYMVYEIIVEGEETRLMALFKGQDIDQIGPVRSARHYFIDYAMENDAIYTHFGESPQAKSDLKKYSINDIDGIAEDGTTFWRVKTKAAPHNAMTSTENLLKSATNKSYRTTSSEESVLNYVTDEVNLESGQDAINITIPHSNKQIVTYKYDAENKVYERYARNKSQTDLNTNEIVTTKNIIITFANNYTLSDKENKGRQGLDNVGLREGYYITNGKAIKITCEKPTRTDKTVYKDLEGNIIEVNDGNTFVNIVPENAQVKIEGNAEV